MLCLPLPVVRKLDAIREVALAKIQHLFANVHIPQNVLLDMNNKTVQAIRKGAGAELPLYPRPHLPLT